jgi:hypothetical protein|tara:strand:+ start:176 stop:403 length:228 start_codon:yes stop_codon:yes gene_type:complete
MIQFGDKWFKIKIFGQQVNWATFVASGVLFVGLELYRRKYIEKKIQDDVNNALAQAQEGQQNDLVNTILDEIGIG